MELIDTATIPEYAIVYIIYGDDSGLNDDDIIEIDYWLQENDYHDSVFEIKTDYPEFTIYPAFGLPCECVEVNVYK